MWKPERARDPNITWMSLLGLILVPLLVSGGFLWATWNSDTRLDRVQAAIVNNDDGVTLDEQVVPLGRQLAGGLVNGEDGVGNFDWVLTDDEDARQGLSNGTYAAVVTLPPDFSKRATSFSKDEVSQIEPAEIAVQTSQVSGITDGAVAQVITTAARDALNTELTEQYLDNIYLGFNSTKKQFQSVATGARQLADGAGGLSDGLDQTSAGAIELADGLEQLDDGTQQLADGTGELDTGATQLADGVQQLADNATSLPSGARKLAEGAQQSADGADELHDGVKQYVGGIKSFRDGSKQTDYRGFDDYVSGVDGYTQLGAGVDTGLNAFAQSMDSFQDLPPAQLTQAVPCPFPDSDPEVVAKCQGYYAGFVGGTQAAVTGLTTKQDVNGEQLSLLDLSGELTENASGLQQFGDGLSGGLDKIITGGGELSAGVGKFAAGLDQLADGTDELADGLKPLATGIANLSTGASELAKGVTKLADGTSELAIGTSQSATGGRQLSDGLVTLADGGSQLATGSDELATGLEKGAKQIPTYGKEKRTALSSVVATPVTAERPGSLFADLANTTFLSVIALWLGGLASFIVLRAIPSRVLTSMKPSWRLAGEALLPAAGVSVIQATVLAITLQVLLDLSVSQVAGLLPFLILAGLAFVGINHALVAWLGGFGRFLSVAVVVLAAATAITHAIPSFLAQLVPFLPLTPALEGVRAIASGGPGAPGAAALLLAWLVAGTAAGVLAVARHRMAKAPGVVPVRV